MVQKWLCIAAMSALTIASAHARNILLISNDPGRPLAATLLADPLAYGTTFNINPSAFAIFPTNSADRYFIVSSSSGETVQVAEGRFPNLTQGTVRIPTNVQARAAAVGLGGRMLVVVGTGGVALIDAQTNSVVGSFSTQAGSDPLDVAVSVDGTRAFVLSAVPAQLTAIDLQTRSIGASVAIPSAPTAVAVGPNGLVYVSANGAIYEIDGLAMRIRATFPINGQADQVQFTPDGRLAVARSLTANTGRAAFVVDLTARRVAELASSSLTFTDLEVVDSSIAYAITSQGTLYALNLAASGGQIAYGQANVTGGNVPEGARELASSGETPQSRRLVVRADNGIFAIDPTTNNVVSSIVTQFSGTIYSFTANGTGPVISIVGYGTAQTFPAGSTSAPLVVRVLDQAGLPLAGIPVRFSTSAAGVTLSAAEVNSNHEGYAAINATLATSATGASTITASAGGRTATFTLTVGADPGGTGGGTGTPPETGLIILQGQGQVVNAFEAAGELLRVRLLDAQGRPVPDATIQWQLQFGGSGNVFSPNPQTDANGEAEARFQANALTPGQFSLVNRIEAIGPEGQRALFIITSLPGRFGQSGLQSNRLAPTEGVITGRAGEVIPGAIQYAVGTLIGARLPNVGLRIDNPSGGTTTARCVGPSGYALSDDQGIVTCDLVLGGAPGEIFIEAVLGGIRREAFTVRIQQGPPAVVRAEVSRQFTLDPGGRATLIVTVTDASGNPIPNTTVEWEAPSGGSVERAQTTTDGAGRTAINATAPTTPGQYVYRVRAGSAVETFTFTVQGAVGRAEIVGGNNQSAAIGQRFGSALSVRVLDGQSRPLSGATVTFRVTSGNATLSRETATTNAEGIASVDLTAGNNAGNVVVTATSGQSVVNFNLNVRAQGPQFTATDIVNVAGFQAGISPGSLARIRVRGIATDLRGSTVAPNIVGPWPTRLAGVEVLFNDILVPIYAVSNVNGDETVVVQVPFEVQPGTARVTVRSSSGGSTTVENVEVRRLSPGLFTFTDTNGQVYAVATRPDGSYVTSQNLARRGEVVRLYATGLGQTNPTTGTNRAGAGGQFITLPLIGGVNNAGVRVVSAEVVPGLIGVYAVSVEIPADTATGMAQPVVIAVESAGETLFSNTASLPIQ